jgi:endonuclease-3
MLSSQTKDEVTDAAVAKLRHAVGGTLTIDAIIAANEKTISDAIAKVGFWRKKTQSVATLKRYSIHTYQWLSCCWSRYIKQAAQQLRDDFASDVPKTVDELCSLPGVGPKMAFLALQVAWNL